MPTMRNYPFVKLPMRLRGGVGVVVGVGLGCQRNQVSSDTGLCTKRDRFLISFCLLLLTVSLSAREKCSRENKRPLPTPGAVNLALRCSHVLVEAVDIVDIAVFPVPVV